MVGVTKLEALNVPHTARLTARDFEVLAAEGAFDAYARAELIEGEIFVVNAQFRRHAAVRRQLMRRFEDALAGRTDGLTAVDECNVALADDALPQPDITLTIEPGGDGPIPVASVRLIVEIADTTRDHDLGLKRELYGRHGVPEYWVVDVKGLVIHQMWSPEPEGYASQGKVAFGKVIAAATIEGLAVGTDGLN